MKAIGGYFELELNKGREYHRKALRLNTGRNAFEYVLKAKGYSKVFLPYFTCKVMQEPLKKTGIQCEFYEISKTLYPTLDFSGLTNRDVVVYNNYFGICDENVNIIANENINLIIDNSQAFYSPPLRDIDTFYSARKFFGVPDGAYLYTGKLCEDDFKQDSSSTHCEHLLGRIDAGAEQFYNTFRNNDFILANQDIKLMSKLTRRILESINYEAIAEIRRNNFSYLHTSLAETNLLKIELGKTSVPLVYPYLNENGHEIKKELIKQKIFIPTYWPEVLKSARKESWEYFLTDNLMSLPIDQRYGESEMLFILKNLESFNIL